MDDNSLMPFGKYKGIKMANVPATYLLWFYEETTTTPKNKEVKEYIKDNMDSFKKKKKYGTPLEWDNFK